MDFKDILIKKALKIPTLNIDANIVIGYNNYLGKMYPTVRINDMYRLYPYEWFTYIIEDNKATDLNTKPEDDESVITVLAHCSNSYKDIRFAADVLTRCFELAGLTGVKTNPIADRFDDITMFIPTQTDISDIIYSIFDRTDDMKED